MIPRSTTSNPYGICFTSLPVFVTIGPIFYERYREAVPTSLDFVIWSLTIIVSIELRDDRHCDKAVTNL
jgi:hypothetical protein